ncbi:MAG TPA: CpcT/CpeT family chromophore lyase, partial [Phycisphaerales bacterium]|nr:CpcT/CpeT family chromophore lyase [Phycisphaerales bacterium]
MKNTLRSLFLAATMVSPLVAQQPVDPSQVPEAVRKAQEEAMRKRTEALNAQYPPRPVDRPTPTVKSTDPDVQALVKALTGTFTSAPTGDTPALTLSTAVITVDGPGVDNAIYFELARADSNWEPFRQGVWQVWKKNGNLMVRQYDFAAVPAAFKAAVTGLWAAPDTFPELKSSQLAPVADVALTTAGGGNFSGTGAGPTLVDNAFEFSTSWIITPETLSFTDRGVDAAGKQVWGPAAGAAGPTFKRTPSSVAVERRSGGVVVIDLVPPTATERKLEEFADAAAVAVYYTHTGAEVYNSNTPDRNGAVNPFRWTAGSGRPQGLNIGGLGVTAGTIRRVYIPTGLAFGTNARGNVPPNADLILSLQTQYVGEPKPPAPAPSTPAPGSVPPAGTPGATPAQPAAPAVKPAQ